MLGSEIVVSVTLLGYGRKHVTCGLREFVKKEGEAGSRGEEKGEGKGYSSTTFLHFKHCGPEICG